jgi:hypothetical protein
MATLPHEPDAATAPQRVMVARGNLYISRETCESFLQGVEAVALLDRDNRVLIVPLMPESGAGLLLKVRNAHGDRVVHAQEFFREKGYVEDFEERSFPLGWSQESAALVLYDLPKVSKSAN